MSGQDVLLYDGVCALCNGLVQFVLPRDPQGRFRFASLQSDFGHAILLKYKFNADDLNTFYAIVDYGNSSEHALNKSASRRTMAGSFVVQNPSPAADRLWIRSDRQESLPHVWQT
jgi:hypothetical protein